MKAYRNVVEASTHFTFQRQVDASGHTENQSELCVPLVWHIILQDDRVILAAVFIFVAGQVLLHSLHLRFILPLSSNHHAKS
jgi:hypothetical protein